MPVNILLIRHGETQYNAEKRFMGSIEGELNENGRRQALELGTQLRGERFGRVYASPAKRAQDFARLVFPAHSIEIVPGFREYDFGIFEGLTQQEILMRYKILYESWVRRPEEVEIPEGELYAAFKKRVLSALAGIAAENEGETIAVVTHGGVIRVVLAELLEEKNFWGLIPPCGTVRRFHWEGGKMTVLT